MIKVFLSLPMHGYTKESILDEIAKMEKAVKKIYSSVNPDKIEFVMNHDCIPREGVRHPRPYCLASAIEKIADCYLVVFHPYYRQANGCLIEYEVCNRYDIRYRVLNEEEMYS